MRDAPVATVISALSLAALLLLVSAPSIPGQQPQPVNDYTIGWSNPATHLYDVALTFQAEPQDSVDVLLPIWRPGRYVRQHYADKVQEFSADDGAGRPLTFRKAGLSTWRISTLAGETRAKRVRVRYRFYANTLDAGASLLSAEEAYFNPVNLFAYPAGQILRPVRLTLQLPKGWQVATALTPSRRPNVFTAADYHALADSPVIASPSLVSRQFTLEDVPYTLWFQGRFQPGERAERILPDVEKIARVQTAIFGGAPFDEYFFLIHLVPWPFGHGVEHANSSSIVLQDNAFGSEEGYQGFLRVLSHELFHTWNVKRLRPAALWPYDYMQEQFTTLHWFTEGVTSYYGGLSMRRAGHTSTERYLRDLGDVIDGLQRTPGRKIVSVALGSWDSWLTGYGQGNPNTTVDFYGKGQILGFLLDALIRARTDGQKSLDDAMRFLFETYYRKGRGMPEEGVELAAEQVAGSSFDDFFRRYVSGTDELPYNEILRPFGLRVATEADPVRPEATLKILTRPAGERALVMAIDPESPTLAAGLDTGDELVAVNGRTAPARNWEALLAGVKSGESVRLTVLRRDRLLELDVRAAGGGNLRHVLQRLPQTDERQNRLFTQWLGTTPEAR
jgi:predicted metalloprotease with PDZ domain